ncbi:MAG: efflux transporter outer membrane subunit [Desulfovibrionales bacterium]|nr:efflux transporter outer membrane subunit [Desulfovibrionales bacterium]
MRRRLILILMLMILTGCASLAPERERPDMPVPGDWLERAQFNATGSDVGQLGWRDVFLDPALQELISTALNENRSLRQAALAMDKAMAQFGIARADRIPNVDASGRTSTTRFPADLRSGIEGIDRQWSVGLGVTSFELDFFGRVRNLEESALEQYLATEEARRAVHISLVSQIARVYLALAGDRENLALSRDTLRSRQASLDLTMAKLANGLATELERHQAEEVVAVAQAEVARLKAQVAMDENALAVLVGVPVSGLKLPAQVIDDVAVRESIAPGLPSDLLTRRPDILETEHLLWAAGAEIGAARAAFFPRIGLTTTAGLVSLELTDLFDSAQRTWAFVPSVTMPIFDAGRNRARLDAAKAEQKIRIARYEQIIQNAFREVADALAKNQGYAGQVEAQARRVHSAGQSRILVDQRYQAGLESAFAVHDAERTLFAARQDLLSVRLARKFTLVELFAALGGGWEEKGGLSAY